MFLGNIRIFAPNKTDNYMKNLLFLVCALLSQTASAQIIHEGTFGVDGDNLKWSYNETSKQLVISGTGAMLDATSHWTASFDTGGPSWSEIYRKGVTSAIIKEGVTQIGDYFFYNCTNLKSVSLPNSLTEIRGGAFANCHSLESPITIPKEQKILERDIFSHCYKLTSVTLPEGLERIYLGVFDHCSSLTSIHIPASVIEIDGTAFLYCSGLTSITVAEENPNFYSTPGLNALICKVADVSYPYKANTILAISRNATIPAGGSWNTGYNLFSGRDDIVTFVVPDNLHIGWEKTFADCPNLTTFVARSAYFPGGCFKNCTSLTDVYIYSEEWNGGSLGIDGEFSSDENAQSRKVTLHVPVSMVDRYTETCSSFYKAIVPLADLSKPVLIDDIYYMLDIENKTATVVAKPEGTYTGVLNIPATVSLEFKTYKVTAVAPKAFAGSNGITAITVAAANTYFDARNDCNAIIDKATNTLLAGCAASIIPTTVTAIGEGAFSGLTTLTSLSLHSDITAIGADAFAGCTGLTFIECYAEAVPTIGDGAFTDVTATMQVLATAKEAYQTAMAAYTGIIVVNFPEKIKTPTITYEDGKVKFKCETEGVTFHYQITGTATNQEDTGEVVELSPVYQVKVYATKDGWIDSDEVSLPINALGIKGDVNGDGVVDVSDVTMVVNMILTP